jgi:hypothetical protein
MLTLLGLYIQAYVYDGIHNRFDFKILGKLILIDIVCIGIFILLRRIS